MFRHRADHHLLNAVIPEEIDPKQMLGFDAVFQMAVQGPSSVSIAAVSLVGHFIVFGISFNTGIPGRCDLQGRCTPVLALFVEFLHTDLAKQKLSEIAVSGSIYN